MSEQQDSTGEESLSKLSVNFDLINPSYYDSLKDVCAAYNWEQSHTDKADITWLNCEVQNQEMIDHLSHSTDSAYSKIPGMLDICYKNLNSDLLNAYARTHPATSEFVPRTFVCPSEL